MLTSIALIMILGFLLSGLFNRLKLPVLLGMILTGVVLGPHVLKWMKDMEKKEAFPSSLWLAHPWMMSMS